MTLQPNETGFDGRGLEADAMPDNRLTGHRV